MSALREFHRRTFASLAMRNYRLFFIGQGISQSGTWMQTVAQALLVLELTGSGTALGLVAALQSLPVLLFGAWGGLVVDRYSKRSILFATQSASGMISLLLGGMVLSGDVRLWMVYATAAMLGAIKVVDNPTRHTFLREMVGDDRLANAVSLNSTEMNMARVIGPSIAGIFVATVGLGACFIANGCSVAAVVVMLMMMRTDELRPAKRVVRAKGQLREGFLYVADTPVLRNTLLMMALIGTFTYEFTVILPLFSEFSLEAGSSGYATLTASMGVGAVVGGLYTASRRARDPQLLVTSSVLFGASMLLTAAAPSLMLASVAMLVVGFCAINFTSLANATLQLASQPTMQGRVMALWSVAFLGTRFIGGPIIGAIGEHAGARWGLVVGGVAAIVAASLGVLAARHYHKQQTATLPRPLTDYRSGPD